jgi:hypothetical protein
VKGDLAFGIIDRIAGVELHQRLRRHRLARSAFADQTHDFALPDRKRDIIDSRHQAFVGAKAEREVFYVDQ